MAAVVVVLMLSANTSFADFPRLCRVMATDGFLPEPFVHRGRRLAFSYGVLLLSVLSAVLLIVFGGITDHLIPLFAIGALAAFTMSQVGMVSHWKKSSDAHARRSLVLNALGATATGTTLCVVLFAKFTEGAWISLVIVALVVVLLRQVRAHYDTIAASTEVPFSYELSSPQAPLVVLPLRRWDAVSLKALRFSLRLGTEVVCVQVLTHDRDLEDLGERWLSLVERPAMEQGFTPPRLVVLRSSYRDLFGPLMKFIHQLAAEHRDRPIAVVVPELVEPRWYHYLLHNLTPAMLRRVLLRQGGPQVMIVSAPWHLSAVRSERALLQQ
jgi:hypothetical protein